jgi:hypothetical protein
MHSRQRYHLRACRPLEEDAIGENLSPYCLVIVLGRLEVVSCDLQEHLPDGSILRRHLVCDRLKEVAEGRSMVTLPEEEVTAVTRTNLLSD